VRDAELALALALALALISAEQRPSSGMPIPGRVRYGADGVEKEKRASSPPKHAFERGRQTADYILVLGTLTDAEAGRVLRSACSTSVDAAVPPSWRWAEVSVMYRVQRQERVSARERLSPPRRSMRVTVEARP
jgi:hypothetical protein